MVFVWDLMHRAVPFFPEVSQSGTWVRRESAFSVVIRRAAIISVGTDVGKREVMNFYQAPEDRIHVLPFPTPKFALAGAPVDETVKQRIEARIGGDYVYYPAAFHPHKNHVTLVRALAVLRDRHGVIMHAAFSGGDWGNLAHVKEAVAKLGLEKQVHFMGFVSREELVALYRGARALVFLSLAGPDNIPPLEAFGLGCPAIVAEIPGAKEQMEGAAVLFPPTDENALAEAILKVHRDPALRNDLIARGRIRAAKFNSNDVGRETLRIIDGFEPVRRCWASSGRFRRRFNIARLFGG
jgi:glycosyltransferase involved in cell wall biosynthesis